MAADEGDNFFSRWSRRKVQVRSGEPVPDPARPVAAVVPASPAVPAAPVVPVAETPAPPPPPTLEDTQALTPASDFSRFVARDVSPEVRNAAVKKLFADPHFNVMDGLDIYIDDYSKPSPLSAADMAKMVSAQFLKLVDDPEEQERKKAEAAANGAALPAAAVDPGTEALTATDDTRAPDAAEPEETPHDDHADLQLQPDHAPGPQGPGPGAG
jgi:Protein of unknown function (DUF3306)